MQENYTRHVCWKLQTVEEGTWRTKETKQDSRLLRKVSLPELIWRLIPSKLISIKIPATYIYRVDKLIPKFMWRSKKQSR